MENYLAIIAAFNKGAVNGYRHEGTPQHVETFISHVFLFKETVFKIYKRENDSFNAGFRDLNDTLKREHFYKEDFSWNSYFNPAIYERLVRASLQGELLEITPDSSFGELVIEMKRIDPSKTLANILREEPYPKEEDFAQIGYTMSKLIAEFPNTPTQENNFYQNVVVRLIDIREWAYIADPHIPRSYTDNVINKLKEYVENNRENFESYPLEDLVIAPDNHADNILYTNNNFSFMDLYPPKEDWLLSEPFMNICRLATDVLVFAEKGSEDALIRGYKKYYGIENIDENRKLFWEIYSAMIRSAYMFMLSKNSEGERYLAFVEASLPQLKT